MEYTTLGNTDIQISKLCVGCMSFGKAGTMHDWTLDETETEKVTKHALSLGINFFDTANGYSAGTSEEYLGRALKKNLLYREDERELIPICKQMGVSLMPYSPLAAGHLTRPQWNTDTLRSQTDRVAMGKYDRTEEQDMQIVLRVQELAERYGVKMQQIALAWHWAKGVASPIIGATKARYLDDAVGALAVKLTAEDIAYLEEPYLPHRVVGAIDRNPADGVMLLDEKK